MHWLWIVTATATAAVAAKSSLGGAPRVNEQFPWQPAVTQDGTGQLLLHRISRHARAWLGPEQYRGPIRWLFRADMLQSVEQCAQLLTTTTTTDSAATDSQRPYGGDSVLDYATLPRFFAAASTDNNSTQGDTFSVTLFTQLSYERLPMLGGLLKAWPGPISIALYIDDPQWLQGGWDTDFDGGDNTGEDAAEADEADPDDSLLPLDHPLFPLQAAIRDSGHQHCDVHLVFGPAFTADPVAPRLHPYDLFYPINTLRNIALLHSRTEFVFGLDVDFLPSSQLHDSLVAGRRWVEQVLAPPAVSAVSGGTATPYGNVLIVPAFEQAADVSLPIADNEWTIGALMSGCAKREIIPFHSRRLPLLQFDDGRVRQWCEGRVKKYHVQLTNVQAATNFRKWLALAAASNAAAKAASPVSSPISDAWTDNVYAASVGRVPDNHGGFKRKVNRFFEPYIVGHKMTLGLYDGRFRGYSFNKRTHITQLQYRLCSFLVHPGAFVLHREHRVSDSSVFWHRARLHSRKYGGKGSELLKQGAEGVVERVYRSFLRAVRTADPAGPFELPVGGSDDGGDAESNTDTDPDDDSAGYAVDSDVSAADVASSALSPLRFTIQQLIVTSIDDYL